MTVETDEAVSTDGHFEVGVPAERQADFADPPGRPQQQRLRAREPGVAAVSIWVRVERGG